MNNVFIAGLTGYLTDFMGIGAGALFAYFLHFLNKKSNAGMHIKENVLVSLAFEFSSGLMMAIVTFRLIPDALSGCGVPITLCGIFSGLIFSRFTSANVNIKNENLKMSLIMLINLWLHNIPEGFALGNSVNNDITVAALFFAAILIHNIPQGFLIVLPAVSEKIDIKFLLYLLLLSGIPTALGGAVGALIGDIAPSFTGLMLSFAAGSLLYVLTFELSYEARKMYGRKIIEGAYILGLISGIIIT